MVENFYFGGGIFLEGFFWILSCCGMIFRNRVLWNYYYIIVYEWIEYCCDIFICGEGFIERNENVDIYIFDVVKIFNF